MDRKISFAPMQGAFSQVLKERVQQYFAEKGISMRGGLHMAIKSGFYLSLAVMTYVLIISGILSVWGLLLAAMLMGFLVACIGFNVGHDAIHGAMSHRKWVNTLMGLTFEIFGASVYLWRMYHNVIHHTYTNIPGADRDIDGRPLLKLAPTQPTHKVHRFQYIYAFAVYTLTSLNWVLRKDYQRMFMKHNGVYTTKMPSVPLIASMFMFKLVHFTLFLILPIIVLPVPFWMVIIGFLVMHMTTGITLALVFQMAHVVEGMEFPEPHEDGMLENEFFVHQLKTTANFSRKSKIATWICGGLNLQVEHHLFPHICHTHYPAISDIVKRTAQEFGIPYHENTSFWSALASHVRHLRKVGYIPVQLG